VTVLINECYSGDKIKKKVGRTCGTCGEKRSVYRALVRRPDELVHIGRPRRRRKENIKMDLREI
jgi:hypothetical protein